STLPYVDAYPEAEVHAIDVAAPMLRYAHARAEALGRRVHFSQQNAESTNFRDESFDLIVSHILLHETSAKAVRNIVRECHRLLRKGEWRSMPRSRSMQVWILTMLSCSIGTPTTTTSRSGIQTDLKNENAKL